jgi:hypothetical protein
MPDQARHDSVMKDAGSRPGMTNKKVRHDEQKNTVWIKIIIKA